MVTQTAPQWLVSAYIRAAVDLGADAPKEEIKAQAQSLIAAWQSPDRHFHDLRHLTDMLSAVDELADSTHDPAAVRIAAWYHGAVFSATVNSSGTVGEDGIGAAKLAVASLSALGVEEPEILRVKELIETLHRHNPAAEDIDAQVLNDADLTCLARMPQEYRRYCKQIRAEYAHVNPVDFVRARRLIVHRFLARRRIYSSPLGSQWEETARHNLEGELSQLNAEYFELAPHADDHKLADVQAYLPAAGPSKIPTEAIVIKGRAAAKRREQRKSGALETPQSDLPVATVQHQREKTVELTSSLESAEDCLEPLSARCEEAIKSGKIADGIKKSEVL